MLTLKKINREIAAPLGVKLWQGEGYFYLTGRPVERARDTSILVDTLNQLSSEQWERAIKEIIDAAKNC